jgi:membrane protease YdiL (CAAX protease family)
MSVSELLMLIRFNDAGQRRVRRVMLSIVPFTIAIFAMVLSYTWLLAPRLSHDYVSIPVSVVGAIGVWNAFRTKEWGFAPRALIPGLQAATLFTLPLVVIFLAAGAALGTLHPRGDVLATFGGLFIWGAAQQWILQTVVLREAQRASARTTGVTVAALLFAALHLPNPFLTVVTLVGGLGWCAIYDRYPNIIPLALSHAFGTLAILHAFDDRIIGRLRVGYSYLLLDGG